MSSTPPEEAKLQPQDVLEFYDEAAYRLLAPTLNNKKHQLAYCAQAPLGAGIGFGTNHRHSSPLEEVITQVDAQLDESKALWQGSWVVSSGSSFGEMYEATGNELGRGFEFVTAFAKDLYQTIPVNSTSVSVASFAKRDKSVARLDIANVKLAEAALGVLQERGIKGWIEDFGQYVVSEVKTSCYFGSAFCIEGHAKYEQTRLEAVLSSFKDNLTSSDEEHAHVIQDLKDETEALGSIRALGVGLALRTSGGNISEETGRIEHDDAGELVVALRQKYAQFLSDSESKWQGAKSRVTVTAWSEVPAFMNAVQSLGLETDIESSLFLPGVQIMSAVQEVEQRVDLIQKRAKRLMELDFFPGPPAVQEVYRERIEKLTTQWTPGIAQTLRQLGHSLLPRLNTDAQDWWNFMAGIRDAEILVSDLETGKCYLEVSAKASKSWFGWNAVSSKATCVVSTSSERHSFDNSAIYPRFSVVTYHFDPEEKRAELLWKLTGRGEQDAKAMDFDLRNVDISKWKKVEAKYTYQTMDATLSIKFLEKPIYREI